MRERRLAKRRPVIPARNHASPFGRFARQSRGNAFVEYAVLLGLLAGAGVLAYYSLGPALRLSFSEVAAVGESDGRSAHADPARSDARPGPLPQTAPAWPRRLPSHQLTGWYAAMAAGIAVWYLLHGRRRANRRRELEEDDSLSGLSSGQWRSLFEKRQQILSILSRDATMLLGSRVEVRHLMTRDPVTVEPATRAREVTELMSGKRIHHLLVCTSAGKLLGIISDRDLRHRRGETAGDLMAADPTTVVPGTPVGQAITVMLDRNISCLPVVEEGVLVGILTTTDLMMSLQCMLQVLSKLAAELELPWDGREPGNSGDEPLPSTISAYAARRAAQEAEIASGA